MNSCIYAGSVRHRRFAPVANDFSYRIFMVYLDLAELDHVFDRFWLWSTRRPALAWFRRGDHAGDPRRPLDAHVRDLVERETGRRPGGPIRLLTHLRYFGYCFNPISVYYCFDPGERLAAVVLEVSNTPWGETHCYVLPAGDQSDPADPAGQSDLAGLADQSAMAGAARLQFDFDKNFHVSPFLPMDMRYRARVTAPAGRLFVGLENWRGDERVFDAHLALDREPIGHLALARHLLLDPIVTIRVISLIMWQALKLLAKRAPFFPHPRQQPSTTNTVP